MAIGTKMFPSIGGWTPSYKELFLEFTGSDGKKYRTGLKPKEYPFYAGVPVVNGIPDFSQAVFSVDKNGNVKMKNAYIEGTIIAGANSEIDWSYIKNVWVKDAQIESLSANKITAGTGIVNALTIKNSLTIGSGGCVRQGQSAYDSGIGFWLGDVAGTPKFSIGNSAGNKLTWDGITLTIYGKIQTGTGSLINGQYIDSLDAGKITTGTLDASIVNVTNLNASNITAGTLTGRTIRTGTGDRVELIKGDDIFYPNELRWVNSYGKVMARIKMAGWVSGDAFDIEVEEANYVRILGDLVIAGGCFPAVDELDLGGSTNKWQHLYLSGNAYIDGTVYTTYLAANYLLRSLNANNYNITNIGTITASSLTVGNAYTYDVLPRSSNYFELGSLNYPWYKIWVRRIDGAGDTIVLHNHLRPNATNINLGNSTYYFNEIFAKYFTDVGCLGFLDLGVTLQNGKKVSDLEALHNLKPSKKMTRYGVPMIDYKSFPKEVYRAPDTEDGQDGVDLSALISLLIGAIKELDKKVAELESKI
jgi:hypothetical protein